MELTPEERQHIYEEEKARQEAREQIEKEAKQKKARYFGIGCLSLMGLFFLLVWVGSDAGSQGTQPYVDLPDDTSPITGTSPSLESRLEMVSSVNVRGMTISVGDLFDDVTSVLTPADQVGEPEVRSDPSLSNSLIVTHTYGVNFDTIRIEARRTVDPGPYRITKLWFAAAPR